MPAIAVPKNALAIGAGTIYFAPLSTAFPANTVVGNVFTDAWASAGAWLPFGITKNGHELNYEIKVEQIDAEEYYDPVAWATTGRSSGIKFELMQVHLTNLKRVLNGGTLATTGSGTTLLSTYTPPAPGAEVRCMLGWESSDNTERFVAEQCLQSGSLAIKRQKGANVATLPVEFKFELPASGFPYYTYGAGTLRG